MSVKQLVPIGRLAESTAGFWPVRRPVRVRDAPAEIKTGAVRIGPLGTAPLHGYVGASPSATVVGGRRDCHAPLLETPGVCDTRHPLSRAWCMSNGSVAPKRAGRK